MTDTAGTPVRDTAGMVHDLLEGFFLPLRGARLLWGCPKARRQALYPLLANLLVYVLMIGLGLWLIHRFDVQPVSWDFWWGLGSALASAVNYLLPVIKWLILMPLLLAVCYFSFTFVGMLIASPFNDLLSETLEKELTGREPAATDWKGMLRSMTVSLISTLRIVCKQGLCALCCLPLLLIPVLGAALMFVVMAYFAGLGFLDIGMARNGLPYRHKMSGAQNERWRLIGLGAGMQLLLLIPLAGLLVLPLGVSAGTLLYCRLDWRNLLAARNLPLPQGFVPPQLRTPADAAR